MELRVLKYFLVIATEGNMTRASELLHITQPTLSRQIMQLEEELGTSLFIRGKRKMVLTEDGLLLKRRAEDIIGLVDKTELEIGSQHREIDGDIAIGCGLTEATNTLIEYIDGFKKLYPQVTFQLRNGNTDFILQHIDNGLIDIGIVLEPVELEKLDYIRLKKEERWGLLVRKDSPLAKKGAITIDDLIDIPLINTSRVETQNYFKQWAKDNFSKLQITATSDLTASSNMLVKRNLGNAIIIEGAMSSINTDELCFKPFYPDLITHSLIVWKKNQSFNLTVSKFIQYLNKTQKL